MPYLPLKTDSFRYFLFLILNQIRLSLITADLTNSRKNAVIHPCWCTMAKFPKLCPNIIGSFFYFKYMKWFFTPMKFYLWIRLVKHYNSSKVLMYLSHIFIHIQSQKYFIIFRQNLDISTIVWCLKFYLLIKKFGSPSKCYDSFVEGIPPIVLKIPNPFWWTLS